VTCARALAPWLRARALGALLLAAVVLPALSPLHLAFGDHGHRYNAETRQFEDVIFLDGARRDRHDDSGAAIERAPRVVYLVCSVSNLSLLRYAPATERAPAFTLRRAERAQEAAPAAAPRLLSVVSIAPKQSPPAAG
jgi:hypothetical protein